MQITIAELAKLTNAEIVGNSDAIINNIAKIEEGKNGDLSFLANPKYEPYLYTTNSTAVLVSRNFKCTQTVNATLLKVDDPYAAFTFLLEKFSNPSASLNGVSEGSYVSPSATLDLNVYIGFGSFVGENASIAENTKIYPQVFVGSNVKIGANCIIYPGVKIYHDCVIGNNVILHAGTIIGCDGFGFAPLPDKSYKKIPQTGNVIIEDDVELGSNCAIDRATMGSTIIRKGAKLDNLVQVAHNVEIGEHTVLAAQTGIAGSTKLGKYIMTGGQVGFAGHINIADGNMFGAQSGIGSTIKDENKKWNGSPAFDLKDSMRALSVYRKLPDLLKRIELLEKQLNNLKNN